MAGGRKKKDEAPQPSTSRDTSNQKETVRRSKRAQAATSKATISKENHAPDSSSDDDFEPSPPKVTKKAPAKVEKTSKKSPKDKKPPSKAKKSAKSSMKTVDKNANHEEFVPCLPELVSKNILCALNNLQNGTRCRTSFSIESCARNSIVAQLKDFQVYKSVTPFDRRVTAMAWHPKRPNLCAVGSKGGEIILWNYEKDEFEGIGEGIGPGGSIQKIMFDGNNSTRVYTCSIDGTFECKDLGRTGAKSKETFLNTHNWDKWYTSFDIAPDAMTIITGENSGYVTLLDSKGK